MTTSKELREALGQFESKQGAEHGAIARGSDLLLIELFERIEKIEAALPPTAWIMPIEGPPLGETIARLCDGEQP